MAAVTLIYCGDGNARFAKIAIDAGFQYGTQLPKTIYYPPYFVDQDWKKPNRKAYMEALARYRPYMASVLDWERWEQLPEVLSWAEEASQYIETVMIIPKVQGGIAALPHTIEGRRIRLGYSVPTRYGGTILPYSDFFGRPVHLLGGSPHKQMELTAYMNVVSADGNMSHKLAIQRCSCWSLEKGPKGHYNRVQGVDYDLPYEAFRQSCINIIAAWKQL